MLKLGINNSVIEMYVIEHVKSSFLVSDLSFSLFKNYVLKKISRKKL